MAAPNAAAVEALVAQARAEMATVLVGQFQQDLNALREAAEVLRTQAAALEAENSRLKAENAMLRARLAQEDVDVDAEALGRGGGEGGGDAAPGPVWLSSPLQRPPPEGTLFSNGGPYNGRDHQSPLKKELNKWTRAHGYSIRILRSKFTSRRIKLTITCNRAGTPRPQQPDASSAGQAAAAPGPADPEAQEPQPRPQPQLATAVGTQARPRQRKSRARDCQLRFMLQEVEPGSGTFVVEHAYGGIATYLRCNHEPDPVIEAAPGEDDAVGETE